MTPITESSPEPTQLTKPTGRKKFLAGLLPFLLLLKSKALTLVGLVAIFMAITFIAGILYFVYRVIKAAGLTNPSPNQTTNTFANMTFNNYDTGQQIAGDLYPNMNLSTNRLRPQVLTAGSGFQVQYGLDINSNPWTANGGDFVPQNVFQYGAGYATNGNFVLTTPQGTWTYQCMNTNAAPVFEFDGTSTNGFQTTTDSVGDVISYAPPAPTQSTNTVILLRTTDFLSWIPVTTNEVVPGAAYVFTDNNLPTNGAGMPEKAFYKTAYNPLWDTNQP